MDPCCVLPIPEGLFEELDDLRGLDHTQRLVGAPHLLLFVILASSFLASPAVLPLDLLNCSKAKGG